MPRVLNKRNLSEPIDGGSSDSVKSNNGILFHAAKTDFEDETSLRRFEDAFIKKVALRGELLWWLADPDPHEFCSDNGPALVKWLL